MPTPAELEHVAQKALEFVPDGGVIGLGTGKAATAFIHALAQSHKSVRGVPTSQASASLAEQLGIPLTTLDEVAQLDVDFDGADEVDPAGQLIKGYGGALVREKIVAAASRQFVVLVTPEKLVPKLGHHGKLPVEVLPFAIGPVRRLLPKLGCEPTIRMAGDRPYVTDNGNWILDCAVGDITDPAGLDAALREICGVVGTGIFANIASVIVIGGEKSAEVRMVR